MIFCFSDSGNLKPSLRVKLFKVFQRWYSSTSEIDVKISFTDRSSRPEVFIRKGVLKLCRKFTGEHPYQSVISIQLLYNFIEIALRHRCSPVNLLHNFRTPCPKNSSWWVLLHWIFPEQQFLIRYKIGFTFRCS